jgi:hypothetical protein
MVIAKIKKTCKHEHYNIEHNRLKILDLHLVER